MIDAARLNTTQTLRGIQDLAAVEFESALKDQKACHYRQIQLSGSRGRLHCCGTDYRHSTVKLKQSPF